MFGNINFLVFIEKLPRKSPRFPITWSWLTCPPNAWLLENGILHRRHPAKYLQTLFCIRPQSMKLIQYCRRPAALLLSACRVRKINEQTSKINAKFPLIICYLVQSLMLISFFRKQMDDSYLNEWNGFLFERFIGNVLIQLMSKTSALQQLVFDK